MCTFVLFVHVAAPSIARPRIRASCDAPIGRLWRSTRTSAPIRHSWGEVTVAPTPLYTTTWYFGAMDDRLDEDVASDVDEYDFDDSGWSSPCSEARGEQVRATRRANDAARWWCEVEPRSLTTMEGRT